MIEAEPIEADVGQQVDDAVEVVDVLSGDGVAQSGLQPDVQAGLDPLDRRPKRPVDAPELVVALGEAVHRDARVGQSGLLQLAGPIGGQKRPVRREHGSDARLGGVGHQLGEILPDHRLAAREQHDGRAVVRQVVEQPLALRSRQLAGLRLGLGAGVAVDALEVTPVGGVPDHDRAALGALGDGVVRAGLDVVPEAVAVRGVIAQQRADGDHVRTTPSPGAPRGRSADRPARRRRPVRGY